MKPILEFATISLEKFSAETLRRVEECRSIVGYQSDEDWICPGVSHGSDCVRSLHPDKANIVGGFACYPCWIKEATDWKNRGHSIPDSDESENSEDHGLS